MIEAPLPAGAGAGPPGTARIAAETTDRVELEVEATRAALLVLSDQDAPGWRAEVDGALRPIVTANYLARGVRIAPGDHRVVFRYRTPGLREGWLALGAALAAIAGWWLARRRNRGVAGQAG